MFKKTNLLPKILVLFIAIIAVIDMVFYLKYRIDPADTSVLVSWAYESKVKSYLRWFLCLLAIVGIGRVKKVLSAHMMAFSSIGIILLALVKGKLFYILKGSFVFNLYVFEIIAIGVLLISFIQIKKKDIVNYIIFVFATVMLFMMIIPELPGVQIGY